MISLLVAAMAAPVPVGASAGPNVWGGPGAILEANDAGAQLEFDCARGRIDGRLPLDTNDRFDQLTLTVRKGDQTVATFTLRRGMRPPLRKCR
jgi:hypothetical protein